ncbi:MAG TPA: metalloregulator ArsR/SmtB family transcription factor [Candidatus Limnocylindrales bacterium]|nr:metalloregulator ArsR/SmtB family transcription factor [Candidatus Limnocylindrales bacterium]
MRDELDGTLRAISDPTRRQILQLLGTQPGLTTGQLAERVGGISRWAVMKHLAVLRKAGLVQTLDEGRRRRHYRELPPLRAVERWLQQELDR